MNPLIIGIAGPAGSGKSTLAERLQERIAGDSARMSFADPIRGMLRSIGITPAQLATGKHAVAAFGQTPRHMLQTLGTEWGRNLIHPDIWLTLLADRVAAAHVLVVLVDDVRFPNEAEWVRARGVMIHLETYSTPTAPHSSHVSERPVPRGPADIIAPVYQYDLDQIMVRLGFNPYDGTRAV